MSTSPARIDRPCFEHPALTRWFGPLELCPWGVQAPSLPELGSSLALGLFCLEEQPWCCWSLRLRALTAGDVWWQRQKSTQLFSAHSTQLVEVCPFFGMRGVFLLCALHREFYYSFYYGATHQLGLLDSLHFETMPTYDQSHLVIRRVYF